MTESSITEAKAKAAIREFGVVDIAADYGRLKQIVASNFDPRICFMMESCASVIASLCLNDLPNPIGLNLVGGPSTGKTTVLSFFYGLDDIVYRCDDFTPSSFVSQAAQLSTEKLSKVDLLPRIRHKCMIVPELAPLFGTEADQLRKSLSVLTRVFDGEGLTRDAGVHGQRGYKGDYHFAWLGATTPIKKGVWKVMGNLGSRFLFLDSAFGVKQDSHIDQLTDTMLSGKVFKQRVMECRSAVTDYFHSLSTSLGTGSFHRSVTWPVDSDNRSVVRKIANLAVVSARLRSSINVWTEKYEGTTTTEINDAVLESPERLCMLLLGLAKGHAILNGRRKLSDNDLPLACTAAVSSIPDTRRLLLLAMVNPDHPDKSTGRGDITTSEAQVMLGFSKPTIFKLFAEFESLGVGQLSRYSGPEATRLSLIDELQWFATDDFLQNLQIWHIAQRSPKDVPF